MNTPNITTAQFAEPVCAERQATVSRLDQSLGIIYDDLLAAAAALAKRANGAAS